ncbi:MAG: hypothetical protein ACYS8X_08360 [Planctomycetota bacterium]|jgi:hypothetical protein
MVKSTKHIRSAGGARGVGAPGGYPASMAFLLTVAVACQSAAGQDVQDLNVQWAEGHRALQFVFRGNALEYPHGVTTGEFPAADQPPEVDIESGWPLTTYHARWTVSTKDWPAEHRANALDLILLRACDADVFDEIYPEAVSSSHVTSRPELVKGLPPSGACRLAEAMRGGQVGYELVAPGGFGAKDAVITTTITVGFSEDGKTLMYYDDPVSITENLLDRGILFAAHDAGDHIRFEIRGHYISAPRRLFRDEALSRTKKTMAYLIQQMYEYFSAAPTDDEIASYLKLVAAGEWEEPSSATSPPKDTPEGEARIASSFPRRHVIALLLAVTAVVVVLLVIRLKRSAKRPEG